MRRPDLIVPIHDRRKRKRYLTLKRVSIALLLCLAAFVAISIRSEMRDLGPTAYSRYEREPAAPPKAKPVEMVREAPAPAFADSSFIEPPPVAPPITYSASASTTSAVNPTRGDVVIVGGPEGVTIVQKDRQRPVLSGGFGRQ